ncbi:MAG TPA: hypothetical protein VNT79_07675 [Phycisphaerae bacterium]|nr:hypothetical protein [Phycisphaerae bacterium]
MTATPPTVAPDIAEDLPFPIDALAAIQSLRDVKPVRQPITCSDPRANCEIAVGSSWRRVEDFADSRFGTKTLIAYNQPSLPGAHVRAAVTRVPREINPSDFLRILIAKSSARIVRERLIAGTVGELPDFLTIESLAGVQTVTRRNATKDADRIFMVEAGMPRSDYAAAANELLVTAASFKLSNPEGRLTAEPLRTIALARPRFRAAVPASCELYPSEPPAPGRVRMRLRDPADGGRAACLLDVAERADRDTLQDILVQHLREMEDRGIRGSDVRIEPWLGNHCFREASISLAVVDVGGISCDWRLMLLEHPATVVLISMIGPAFRRDPGRWAINKRTFEILALSSTVET